jgi:hypothetical protein
LIALIFAIPAASTLVDKGSHVQALATKYATELATLQQLTPETQQALSADPTNQAAQVNAVSELSGVPQAVVARAITLSTHYAQEIETAAAIDESTLSLLASNPQDAPTAARAVAQIEQALQLSPDIAVQRLQSLAAVPADEMQFLATTGREVQRAADQLTAAGRVPTTDLEYLQENTADVLAAQKDSPRQWQRWWWLCLIGQIAFLPFVWMLTGKWSPAAARRAAAEHEATVQRELAALERTPARV